jgi:hypothetical protein
MHKKLITACMALVAFAALAIGPASASATNTPLLTAPAGTTAAVGSSIVGTAGNTFLLDTSGNQVLSCEIATMTGEITKNTGGNVEGNINSAKFVGSQPAIGTEPDKACTAWFNMSYTVTTPWCLRSTTTMVTDEFQIRGGKCSEASKSIVFHQVTEVGTCTYERSAATGPIKGTFTTGSSPASLTVTATAAGSGFAKTAGPFVCPSSAVLNMTFTLENGSGQAAVIDG